jgi:hypothetical protein
VTDGGILTDIRKLANIYEASKACEYLGIRPTGRRYFSSSDKISLLKNAIAAGSSLMRAKPPRRLISKPLLVGIALGIALGGLVVALAQWFPVGH